VSIPLTAIAFYFKYGERISKWDIIASFIYLSSNFFVVLGAGHSIIWSKDGSDENFTNVVKAIGYSAITGIIDTISVLNLRFIIRDV
jgi:drug/metabolite transporter (DMT)-like permease